MVRGLNAGSYEVGLTHAPGSGGRVRFDYVPGQLTELRIPAPAVTLTGVVRINGQAVRDASIMFMTRPLQSVTPGVNRLEWDITGGTLVVRDLRASERTIDDTISIWYNGGFQGGSAPSFGSNRELRGAPFSTHRVAIKRGSAPEETIGSVVLSAEAPRAEVVIDAR